MEGLVGFADLLELQQVDTRIDQLVADRRSMPELAEYAGARQAAGTAAVALDESTNLLASLDRDLARSDHDLQMSEQKLSEQERRLFAGGLNARETENLRAEVQSLRRRISSLEDETLELLEQREDRQGRQELLQEQAEATKQTERDLAERVSVLRATIDAALERQREHRAAVVELVGTELLRMYRRLRERRKGVVVGEISEGRVCGACHLGMSIGEFEEIKEDAIPQCINCAAILVM